MKKDKNSSTNSESNVNNQNISSANPVSQIQIDQINQTGSVVVNNGKFKIYCLTIIGEIEGHNISDTKIKTTKYEKIIPQLVAIEESPDIDGLLILLNTVGGDIEAGLALAELISGMKKPTVSLVIGGGHSIGVPLAVSAKKTFMAKSASMVIHPVRSTGTTLGTTQSFEYLKRMQNRITRFIEDNSNISSENFLNLVMNKNELDMDTGTILDGYEAVEVGIIDDIGNLSDALNCLYDMINNTNNKKSKK